MKKIRFLSLFLVVVMLLASLVIPVAADEPTLEVLGAQIRTEGTQGIRFIGRVKKSAYTLTTGANANFGFLIIPKTQIASNATLAYNTTGVKMVKASNLMPDTSVTAAGLTYDSNYYYFTVVLTGIPQESYGTTLKVKAYVNTSGTTYAYSNSPLYEERSIYSVAKAIQDKGGSIPTFISNVVTAYNNVGTDILVNGANFGVLQKYPDYPSYIDRDGLYTVSVTQGSKTENLLVYNECAAYSQYDVSSTSRSLGVMDSNRRFCEFAYEFEAVTVNIKVNKKFTSYVVAPTSKGFASTFNASTGTISVTVNQHEYFVVILDDDYKTALAVFPDHVEYDVPTKGATNVVYVEGDNQITLPENQPELVTFAGNSNEYMIVHNHNVKIYLAPGAILKKRIINVRVDSTHQAYNTHIYGRGAILDPFSDYTASSPTQKYTTTDAINFDTGATKTIQAWEGTVINTGYSFYMDDVKLLDSRNYNVWIMQSSGSHINHVKLLSTEMSTDGFMIQGNHEVTNCFVYCGDNALVMGGGDGSGTTYDNITIGTTCAAVYPQYSCQATLSNIYIFRADDNLINVHQDNSGAMTVNITGLDALDCVKTPLIFGDNGSNGSETKTFNIKNMVTRFTTGAKKSFTAGTYSSQYNAMECGSTGYIFNFTNLCIGGHRIGPDNDGSSMKVGSNYIGAKSAGTGSAISGMTINFAYDSTDTPAHVSIPANKTANYTGGADYVAGPIRPWSRYTSYNCLGYISDGQFKVDFNTEKSASNRWGYSIDLTEQMKSTGAGTYSYSVSTSGKSATGILVKCANNSNSVTTTSGKSGSITVTASDLANYTYHFIVKSSTNQSSGTITLTGWTWTKTK